MEVTPLIFQGRVFAARSAFALIAFPVLVFAGVAGCSNIGSSGADLKPGDAASAPDIAVRSMPVITGRPARVFVFAGIGDNCEVVAPPQITITEPPVKGEVTLVPGQDTTIQYSAKGTCLGQKTTGTGIYYTARAGQEGKDHFAISAKLANGTIAPRAFEVTIAE